MADRNENFLQKIQNDQNGRSVVRTKSNCSDNNNRIAPSPEAVRRDDLCALKGQDYSRSNPYQKEMPDSIGPDHNRSVYKGLYQRQPSDVISNREEQNNCSKPMLAHQKDSINRSNSVDNRHFRKAPIVGWQNGSPTVFPSSPCKTPDTDYLDRSELESRDTSSSKSSGICQDSGNTENLSSIADERLLESTPALTINRSVESLSPDKDTFLTTSPDLGRSKDLSLGDELEDKIDLQSPGTDFTEEKSPTDSYLTSANSTIGTGSADKTNQDRTIRSEFPDKSSKTLNHKNEQPYANGSNQKSANITPNPGYQTDDDINHNSVNSDSALDLADDLDFSSVKEEREKPKVPDGGWGWVVVMASLVISLIADGVSFSFGLLYIEFLHEFGASKSKTAWIGSLFMAVPLLSGPVMSAMVDRYGCKKMTMLGGLVSGLGFVLSSFSKSIEVMYLTFGVIAGLGLGLCYVTAVVSIAFWFDKKRTLAVSLGACGTGIGTFVYAPMTTFFIQEYGWRGTTLLLAGTFFNMMVCGAVMKDPKWWILEQKKQNAVSPKKTVAKSECEGSSNSPVDEFLGVEELRRLLKSGQTPEYLLQSLSMSTDAPNRGKGGNAFRSVVNLPTFVKQSEKVPLEVLESLSSNSRLYNVILENYPNLLLCRSLSDKKLEDSVGETGNKSGVTMSVRLKQAKDTARAVPNQKKEVSPEPVTSIKMDTEKKMFKKETEETNPLLVKEVPERVYERAKSTSRHHIPGLNGNVIRTDSLPWLRRQFSTNTHYFKDIRVHRNSVMYRGAALNLNKYRLRASSCPNIYRNSMTTLAKENEEKWHTELIDLMKGMFDFSMFLELHFLLLSLSTILLFTWFIVPYFYLAEHLVRMGYSESDGANLISIIGITNTIGMIGLGWAGDQPWMSVSKTYAWCLAACGVATIFMPIFTHHYYLLMLTSAAFGIFFASSFSFTPVILVELIPLERFTTAYGLCLLCQGIGNLLGPPLAGWLFDITGSWELSFLKAGGWIIFSGVLIGIIPYTKNRKIWGSGPMEMERDKDCLA